jgi:hypothetical protein
MSETTRDLCGPRQQFLFRVTFGHGNLVDSFKRILE